MCWHAQTWNQLNNKDKNRTKKLDRQMFRVGFYVRKTAVWCVDGRWGWKRGGQAAFCCRGLRVKRTAETLKTDISVHARREDATNMQPEASFMLTTNTHASWHLQSGWQKEKKLFYEMMKTLFYLIIRIRLHILWYSKMHCSRGERWHNGQGSDVTASSGWRQVLGDVNEAAKTAEKKSTVT